MKRSIENLGSLDLFRLLRSEAFSGADALIRLRNQQNHQGIIGIRQGAVVFARAQHLEGVRALTAIFSWEYPELLERTPSSPAQQNINLSLDSLLVRVRRDVAELRRLQSAKSTQDIYPAMLWEMLGSSSSAEDSEGLNETTQTFDTADQPTRETHARLRVLEELVSELNNLDAPATAKPRRHADARDRLARLPAARLADLPGHPDDPRDEPEDVDWSQELIAIRTPSFED